MCMNTSPAPERCFQILPRLIRRRRSVFEYFSGAGEVFVYIYLSDTSPAPEKPGKYFKIPLNTSLASEKYLYTLFPAPEKCLYALIWRRRGRRSIYIHPYELV